MNLIVGRSGAVQLSVRIVTLHERLLPLDGQHERVDTRADSQHADVVTRLEVSRFGGQGHGDGDATEPVLPSHSTVAKSRCNGMSRDSNIRRRWAVPTWWHTVLCNSSRDQPVSARN